MVRGIEPEKQLPGLRSVASATAAPSSINFLAGAKGSFRAKAVSGSSVATVPFSAMRLTPSSLTCSRWSAETAPISAASSAPPRVTISSAWSLSLNPASRAAVRKRRESSISKTFFSVKMSQNSAFPLTAGSISRIMRSMYSGVLPLYSLGTACAPRNVATTESGVFSSRAMVSIASSILISDSVSRPYPLLASTVVTPISTMRSTNQRAFSTRASRDSSRVAFTVL